MAGRISDKQHSTRSSLALPVSAALRSSGTTAGVLGRRAARTGGVGYLACVRARQATHGEAPARQFRKKTHWAGVELENIRCAGAVDGAVVSGTTLLEWQDHPLWLHHWELRAAAGGPAEGELFGLQPAAASSSTQGIDAVAAAAAAAAAGPQDKVEMQCSVCLIRCRRHGVLRC